MTKDYINALYYHKMYNSDACWKGSPRIVSCQLKNLSSEKAKHTAIKENIQMCVKGLGWEWCKHSWFKDGRKYTMYELAKHLQMIITKEKSFVVPNKPLLIAPMRVSLQVLGTQSSQVATLDEKYLSNESDIRQEAEQTLREFENRGEGSMHSQLQPFSHPDLMT